MERILDAAAEVRIADFDAIWAHFCPPEPRDDVLVRWLAMLTPPAASVIELSLGPVPRIAEATCDLPPAIPRRPGTRAPQAGLAYWEMEAAYYRDLDGATSCEIARAMDLQIDLHRENPRSSSADRYVRHGRALLNRLGAWPWAAVANGRLPAKWREQPAFARPLARWHWEGWERGHLQQMRSVDWAGGDEARWRRDSPVDIWSSYLSHLRAAQQRGDERRAREASVAVGKPVPATARYVERARYVLLHDGDELFFKSQADAESWIAHNVSPTHSGQLTLMTMEGWRGHRVEATAERHAA